jgi:hypothetical protein
MDEDVRQEVAADVKISFTANEDATATVPEPPEEMKTVSPLPATIN